MIAWNKGKTKEEYPQLSNSGVKPGNVPWNKGKPGYHAIGKRKGVCDNTGRTHFKKGLIPWNKGLTYKQKEGTGEKISKALRGHPNWYKGKYTKDQAYLAKLERQRKRYKLLSVSDSYHTEEQWEALKTEFNYMCLCCKLKEPTITLTKDHILPISQGGNDSISNIQPLCLDCNLRKFTKHISYLPFSYKFNTEREVRFN